MKNLSKMMLIVAALLFAGGLWGQEAEETAPAEEQPAPEAGAAFEDTVTAQLITSYLDEMDYVYRVEKSDKVPEIDLLMRGNNGNYDIRIFIDNPRKVVYMCVNRFLTLPALHPKKSLLLQRLMELNWELLIGKYEWDKTDGEVRLSYTFSTENGLGYDAFAACFQLLVLTADRDYPRLMRLMWGDADPVPPQSEDNPHEGTKVKDTKATKETTGVEQ